MKKKDEVCSKAADCQSSGDDCTQAGGEGREFACFEQSGNPGEFPEGEDAGEVNGLVDQSASIPEQQETVSTADASPVFIRTLNVELTQGELSEHGEEMARLISLWTKAKLDLKAYSKAAKKVIDEYEERYIGIAEIVESGTEERQVQCYAVYDYPHGVKRIYRCDNYDLVEEVVLTKDELQMDLNFVADQSVANVEAAFGEQEPEIATEGAVDEEPEVYTTEDLDADWPVGDGLNGPAV